MLLVRRLTGTHHLLWARNRKIHCCTHETFGAARLQERLMCLFARIFGTRCNTSSVLLQKIDETSSINESIDSGVFAVLEWGFNPNLYTSLKNTETSQQVDLLMNLHPLKSWTLSAQDVRSPWRAISPLWWGAEQDRVGFVSASRSASRFLLVNIVMVCKTSTFQQSTLTLYWRYTHGYAYTYKCW